MTVMRPHRATAVVATALLVLTVGSGAPSSARPAGPTAPAGASGVVAPADAGIEAQFVGAINRLRASKGLSQLQVNGQLTGVARSWTTQMVQAGSISHNPNLGAQVSGSWRKLGENVGVGGDVDGLMRAFINSPAHYRNLVDPDWNYVGVGATRASDGRLFTTHNFMLLGSAAPPPPPPPPPSTPATTAATTPPPPPTTTTTVPPTTTTTTLPPPEPSEDRVTAILRPLRSLEAG